MNSRQMKIALSIKRQRKVANKKINGGMNHTVKKAINEHKEIFHDGHKNKGGIHRQNSKGFKNEHAK